MKIQSLVRPDFPNSDMAFRTGFASIFDFGDRRQKHPSVLSSAGDGRAMERDWQRVGQDMYKAVERFQAR